MRHPRPLALVVVLAAAVVTATAGASLAAPRASTAHTQRIVVRPVDRNGDPVSGWTVKRQRGDAVSCEGAAIAAVDANILECFPTADYLPACWKSSHHTTLCLRDARRKVLVRVKYAGSWQAASAPTKPSPQDLVLGGGQGCSLRIGGAWAPLPSHPHWQGFYSCRHGDVYGPASGDGINRSHQPWTVHLWKTATKQHVVGRSVAKAFLVGTHR